MTMNPERARSLLGSRIARNKAGDAAFSAAIYALSALMIVPLLLILGYVAVKGIPQLSWGILATDERHGGILNAILGSLYTSGIALAVAAPIGVLCGVWLSEHPEGGPAQTVRTSVDVISGLPSIVVGIIAYFILVVPFRHFSALSGAAALAVMMLPGIIKSSEENLRLVPRELKEGAYALGAPRSAVLLQIVLPAASGGVISGVLLSFARALGETAPLLFTAFGSRDLTLNPAAPMEALPPLIFKYATSPSDDLVNRSWAAAFLLTAAVLAINLVTRAVIAKGKKA
jgi:phosphate transport system permease protein